jgi:hypothetical protein
MVRLSEHADDSAWDEDEVAEALVHYLSLDGESEGSLEARLRTAGVLGAVPVPAGADQGTRFQVLALAAQDLWLAERLRPRARDAEHYGRLRSRFFAALRLLGEHGDALEKGGLVILDPARPWIAPLLAQALAAAPLRVGPDGMPVLVMVPAEGE